jgi:hypothetical protein
MVAEQVTIRLPFRSALFKQRTGGLVVTWVTTGESPLLYVEKFLFAPAEVSSRVEYRGSPHDSNCSKATSLPAFLFSNGAICRLATAKRVQGNLSDSP